MNSREVWFAIPSANPAKCAKVLPIWRKMGYKTAILQNHTRGEIPADRVMWRDSYPGWPESINILCRELVPNDAPLVVSGGDDMLPDPNHSASELLAQFEKKFPDGYGVMQPHGDEFLCAKNYCGSPFLGRGWIERAYGGRGPMPSDYRHNWADNELFWVAKCQGVLWDRPDLSHFHDHFTRNGGQSEDYWTANVLKHDREDCRVFIARSWLGFPGSDSSDGRRSFDRDRFLREYTGTAEMYYQCRFGFNTFAGGAADRMSRALQQCEARGQSRVVIYGAGTHTRACAEALVNPPVEILAIVDDDSRLVGTRLWNFPIVTPEAAIAMRPGAVVLSSNSMEQALARKAAPFERAGAEIVHLYRTPELATT